MEQASARDCIIRGTVDLGGWGRRGERGGGAEVKGWRQGRDESWAREGKREKEEWEKRLDIVQAHCYVVGY